MKNFTKVKTTSLLITLAVIAALAFSCAPPDVDITDYDWKAANADNDPSKTDSLSYMDTLIGQFYASGPVNAKNPVFFVTFPEQSDFLREKDFAASLKGFLTVNTFTNPATTDDGAVSTLTSVNYTVENRAGNTVTLKVNNEYTGSYSDLVIKIDGTKYKHTHGFLLDGDKNGIAGEAGYDDVYLIQPLAGATITGAILPGNKDWSILISSFPVNSDFTWADADAKTSEASTIYAAYISLNSFGSSATIYKEVSDLVVNNIKIERLANDVWTVESATAEYDGYQIRFTNFTATHGAAYRITWNGSKNLASTSNYFGVKQRISVIGSVPNTSQEPYRIYVNGNWVSNPKVLYNLSKVSGSSSVITNPQIARYLTNDPNDGDDYANFSTQVYSFDSNNRNVIFDVTVPFKQFAAGDSFGGFDTTVINNLTKFKESFKIIYSTDTVSDFRYDTNFVYIDITKVEGISHRQPVDNGFAENIDTLRITIDPKFGVPTRDEWVSNMQNEPIWVEDGYEGYFEVDLSDGSGNFNSDNTGYWWVFEDGNYVQYQINSTNYFNYDAYYNFGWVDTSHFEDNWVDKGFYEKVPIGNFYFLINDGFGYGGGKILYGNLNNYAYGKFRLYNINP